jgi:hypothetical protein
MLGKPSINGPFSIATVDRTNPAPADSWFIPFFIMVHNFFREHVKQPKGNPAMARLTAAL